jgi:DNA-nicking Smr family endonuclease
MMADDTRPRRPRISDEERALWRGVTRSVAPLKRRGPLAKAKTATKTETKAAARATALVHAAQVPKTAASKPASRQKIESGPPPLAPLDRRLKQRLGRGKHAIDARLDLHGQTQDRAHASLLRFLRAAQANGAKTVLVITGKGAPGEPAGERGVLRRMVPHWLALAQFRAYVVGIAEAPMRAGGAGALIVSVRRPR